MTKANKMAAEFSRLSEARSKVYGFLSLIYLRNPTQEFVKKLLAPQFERFLTSLMFTSEIPKEMKEGLETVKIFLDEFKEASPEGLYGKLSVEYTRLFRGVKHFYGPPPPYESVYVDETKRVMGESTAKVSEEYSQAGLAIPEQHKNEPPDYIGFELDFMRYLCSQEVSAWKRKRFSDAKSLLERQKKFLSKHIIRWVPDFCDRVLEEAKTGFYRGIAKITKGFVKFEFDQLDYLIDMAKKIEP